MWDISLKSKMKSNLQIKLIISYILIILVAILIVSFVMNYSVRRHFQRYCEKEIRCQQLQSDDARTYPHSYPFLNSVRNSLIIGAVGATILAFVLSFVLFRMMINPVWKIIETIKGIAKGDYSRRVEIKSNDEIGELGNALNKMVENLENIENMRRELVSNVSHELSTPLTIISGYIEAMSDKVIRGTEPLKETLTLLKDEVDRLILMVNDLRKLSSIESSTFKLSINSLDLGKEVDKVILKFKTKFKAKDIILKSEIPSNLPRVKADEDKLSQILINLLDNAHNFSLKGGEIVISTRILNKFIELSISDSGIGISDGDLPHIFERFYRGEKSRSRKTGGTGIGLAIVKELVNAHDGEIKVKRGENGGSIFSFTLQIFQTNKSC